MSAIDTISGGNIEPRPLEDEMRSAYLDYAMSVIVSRALPDVRDGLKPVHRRVLHVMNELGLQPGRQHVKCAQIVGEVMGKYHPHGDSPIYDTLVRLAQDFSMRYPLVDGHGNFGNIDGYSAAAMRYTEARLDRLATEMLRDIDQDTVDFVPTYDGSKQEPVVLPARFPNLLINGGSGIAVGMATNIPPHNLREVIGATIAYIEDPGIGIDGLMKHIKGPDFPTAGTILGREGIRDAYETGRGRVRVQAKAHVEPIGQGKEAIIVTELPYQVRKGGDGGLIMKIRDLVLEKKIPEVTDLRDESDRNGMRIVIELKRDAIPKVVLNKLYKHTPMQTTFGVNMVALVDNVPADAVATRGARALCRSSARGRRAAYAVRAAPVRGAGARARGLPDRARQPRRGNRSDPGLTRLPRGARRIGRAVRADDRAGPGDSPADPQQADRARDRQDQAAVRRPRRADQGAARDPRRRGPDLRSDQGRAQGNSRRLRRRAPDGDHLRRGRARHRGSDRRPADGDLDDALWLYQVAAALDLPPAAPRRGRCLWRRHEGRRLHRAPLRLLDPRLPAVLHQPRQGLPAQGL